MVLDRELQVLGSTRTQTFLYWDLGLLYINNISHRVSVPCHGCTVGVLFPSPAESGGPRRGPLLPLACVAFFPHVTGPAV
jgi:hypothetical protein